MPPPQVGGARRLDAIAQIRKFAKRWMNCLEMYVVSVDDGQAAIYFWPHPDSPALCLLRRHGRVGWAVDDVKGPENAELSSARRQEIFDAFAAAGIPKDSAVRVLKRAANLADRRRRRVPLRQAQDEEEMPDEIYEEFDAA
jgi:hypothetical protein